ncbi:MAG: OmpA family protein [Saprospiraceae bacterium]|nr:OmpA family protein [Saprospiraceae bacterium]
MRLVVKLLVLCLTVGAFQSCVSKKKYDELEAAKAATDQALAETQAQVKTLSEEKDALAAEMESEKTRLNGEISSIKSDLDATKSQVAQVEEKLQMTEKELTALKEQIDGVFNAYSGSGMSLEDRDGRLYVVTGSELRYNSGSSRLSKEEREAVDALAEVLKSTPAAKIMIEGHTDNVPFKAGMGDNWDLSYRRAKAVVTRLIKKGVDPAQLSIAGRGDSMPTADNGTSDGKAANRRTDIVPNPDLGTLKGN